MSESTDRPDRPFVSGSAPLGNVSPSMGIAAPIGAVSRKDRARAARTAMRRDGATIVLRTALPGKVSLQRKAHDGDWETVVARPASRLRGTRVEFPRDAEPDAVFRVVFAPRNTNLTAWVSEPVEA